MRRWHILALTLSQKRRQLVKDMGGKCVGCGSANDLEFHHPDGKDWEPRQLSRTARLEMYRRDFENKNLELRCSDCHLKVHLKPESYEPF